MCFECYHVLTHALRMYLHENAKNIVISAILAKINFFKLGTTQKDEKRGQFLTPFFKSSYPFIFSVFFFW